MFERNALIKLKQWHNNHERKPLVLPEARQVGKTTLVSMEINSFSTNK